MSKPDTSWAKFAFFIAIGLNYDQHTHPTLKNFVPFRDFRG